MKIIVDDREGKSEVLNLLLEMKDATVQVKRLAVGDYKTDKRLLFERKTMIFRSEFFTASDKPWN